MATDINGNEVDLKNFDKVDPTLINVLNGETGDKFTAPTHYNEDEVRYLHSVQLMDNALSDYFGMQPAKNSIFSQMTRATASTAYRAPAQLRSAYKGELEERAEFFKKIPKRKLTEEERLNFSIKILGQDVKTGRFPIILTEEEIRKSADKNIKMSERMSTKVNELNKQNLEFLKKSKWAKTAQDGFWYDLGSGATTLGMAVGISMITRTPHTAAILFGLIQKGEVYERLRGQGYSATYANKYATMAGLFEAGLEFVGLDLFLKSAKNSRFLNRMLFGAITEGTQEASQTSAELAIMQKYGKEGIPLTEAVKDIAYSGMLGALLGGGTSSILGAVEREGKARNLPPEIIEKVKKVVTDDRMLEGMTTILDKQQSKLTFPNADEQAAVNTLDQTLTKIDEVQAEREAGIKETVKSEIVEAGVDQIEAEQVSDIMQARAEAAGATLGITPQEWLESKKLQYKGESPELSLNEAVQEETIIEDMDAPTEVLFQRYKDEDVRLENLQDIKIGYLTEDEFIKSLSIPQMQRLISEYDVLREREQPIVKKIEKTVADERQKWEQIRASIQEKYKDPETIAEKIREAGVTRKGIGIKVDEARKKATESIPEIKHTFYNEWIKDIQAELKIKEAIKKDKPIVSLDEAKKQLKENPIKHTIKFKDAASSGKSFYYNLSMPELFDYPIQIRTSNHIQLYAGVEFGVFSAAGKTFDFEEIAKIPEEELFSRYGVRRVTKTIYVELEPENDKINIYTPRPKAFKEEILFKKPEYYRHILQFVKEKQEQDKKDILQQRDARQEFQNRVIAMQDLQDEVKSVNRKIKANIGTGTVTLYHGTSKENAKKIKKEGLREQSFLSLSREETKDHIKQFKDKDIEILEVNVDPRSVEFSTGTQELYAPKGLIFNPKTQIWQAKDILQQKAIDQTKTPQFKRWFKDSKVVDEKGDPLVVYHGTNKEFTEFKKSKLGLSTRAKSAEQGFFFSNKKDVAAGYGELATQRQVQDLIDKSQEEERKGNYDKSEKIMRQAEELDQSIDPKKDAKVLATYISLKNPIEIDVKEERFLDVRDEINEAIEKANSEKNDGVIIKNLIDNAEWGKDTVSDHYIVFEPTQIKSATANIGTFDPTDPSILKQEARGQIEFGPDDTIIRLFKGKDRSTLLHETGHLFLRDMQAIAESTQDEQTVADMQILRDFYKVKEGEKFSRENEEDFADDFVTYIMSGKAPNAKLVGAFEQFKQWLMTLYNKVKARVTLTPEVQQVFDRMLGGYDVETASTAQINELSTQLTELSTLADNIKAGNLADISQAQLDDLESLINAAKQTPPAEPQSLFGWIRQRGGVWDKGGELRDMDLPAGVIRKRARSSMPNQAFYNSLDTVREAAVAEGFLEEGADINALLNAISKEAKADKQYRKQDLERIETRERVLQDKENAETILAQLEINPEEILKSIRKERAKKLKALPTPEFAPILSRIERLERAIGRSMESIKGGALAKETAKDVQNRLTEYIQKSDITDKDKLKLVKTIKNTQTGAQLEKLLPKLEDRIYKYYEAEELRIAKIREKAKRATEREKLREIKKEKEGILAQARKTMRIIRRTEENIKEVQENVIDLIKAARLDPKDRAKFIATIKNIQTGEQLARILPKLQERIAKYKETTKKSQLRDQIKKELKTIKPTVVSGKAKGKYDAETQEVLQTFKDIEKMTVEKARNDLQKIYEQAREMQYTPTEIEQKQHLWMQVQAYYATSSQSDLQEVLDFIKTLKSDARAKVFEQMEKQKAERDEAIAITTKAIDGSKPFDPKSIKQKPKGIFNFFNYWLHDWNTLLQKVLNDKKWADYLAVSIEDAEFEEMGYWNKDNATNKNMLMDAYGVAESELQPIYARQMDEFKFNMIGSDGQTHTRELTRGQIIDLYSQSKNEETRALLTDPEINAYSDAELTAIFAELSQEDIKLADALFERYESAYEQINKTFKDTQGINLPKVKDYIPRTRETEKDDQDLLTQVIYQGSTAPSAVKRRTGGKSRVKLMNALSRLDRHLEEKNRFVTHAKTLQKINGIFKNPDVRAKLKGKYGSNAMQAIDAHLKSFGLEKQQDLNTFWQQLRGAFVGLKIGLSPVIFLKQLTSVVAYNEVLNPAQFASGMIDFLKAPVKNAKWLRENSEFIKNRIDAKAFERDIKAMEKSKLNKLNVMTKWNDFVTSFVRAGDIMAIYPGMWAMLKAGKTMQEAERFSNKTQQSASRSKLSLAQKGTNTDKLFTMFTSTPQQYLRKIIGSWKDWHRGDISTAQLARIQLLYTVILPALFSAVGSAFRPDKKKKEFTYTMLTSNISGLPFISWVSNTLIAEMIGTRTFPYQFPFADEYNDVAKQSVRIMQNIFTDADKDINWEDFVTGLIEASAPFSGVGIPAKRLWNAAEGVYNITAEGKTKKGLLRLGGYTDYTATKVTE